MEQQINLFEEIKIEKGKNIYTSIKATVEEYGVDKCYEKHFKGEQPTLNEIETKLYKLKNYDEYLNKLYEELKKHFKEVKDDYRFGKVGIAKREKAIITYEERSIGPVYCLSMLKGFIEENASKEV